MKIIILLLLPLQLLAQKSNQSELNKFIKATTEQVKAAGASVLIAHQGKIILNKGYGFAHLGFRVPATPQTKYFVVGPQVTVLATAILQQVEKGILSLDDEIQKYLPDFPLQGKKVTIRHLLTSTSGIPDYHYLGDPLQGQNYQPKALDEVIDLFAGKPFLIEPGSKYDWSISNFALLTDILQRITDQPYRDYLYNNIIKPLDLTETEYLEHDKLITNFAQGYRIMDTSFFPATESLFTYGYSHRLVTTTADLYKIWNGLKTHKLLKTTTFNLMTSKEEAKSNNSMYFGYGIRFRNEDNVEGIGIGGALQGFSGFFIFIRKMILQ